MWVRLHYTYSSHKSSATQSYKCLLGLFLFSFSLIHRTLTWTTGSLTCKCDHLYACVYTWGLDTPTASQHNIFDWEKITSFSCAPDRVQTQVMEFIGSWDWQRSTNWATLSLYYRFIIITYHTRLSIPRKMSRKRGRLWGKGWIDKHEPQFCGQGLLSISYDWLPHWRR